MRVLLSLVALGLVVACAQLDLAVPAEDSATILNCQDVGRACKADGGSDCYGAYDACMRDGGMR